MHQSRAKAIYELGGNAGREARGAATLPSSSVLVLNYRSESGHHSMGHGDAGLISWSGNVVF
jgi:hypothetical protein